MSRRAWNIVNVGNTPRVHIVAHYVSLPSGRSRPSFRSGFRQSRFRSFHGMRICLVLMQDHTDL